MAPQGYVLRAGPDRKELRKAESLVEAFSKTMKSKIKKMLVNKKMTTVVASNTDSLLDMRRALVAAVQKGMLERKDQEEFIGVLAALVWFNRLEAEQQARIFNEWG